MQDTGAKSLRRVRLLALDLDDTLLRSDLSISYRTRNAIRRAEAAGVTVTLASGRNPAAMERFSRLLNLHRRPGFLICSNGAVIEKSDTGEAVFESRIDTAPALTAFDLVDAEGFAVQIYEGDCLYVSRRNEFADYDQRLTGLRQVVLENFRDKVAAGCCKLLIPGDPALLEPLETILASCLGGEITLFTSKPYYLEILPKGCDKGTALERVAALLGVAREETLAIGDSMNDEAMLRWAGLGVAMANSDDRIKSIAGLVTTSTNDDDGVAEVIERFVLE